jgi:DNA-binding CsgD family transcriptional regulator
LRGEKEKMINTVSNGHGVPVVDETGGMILMDASFHAIAYDRGAAVILGIPERTPEVLHPAVPIPKELLDVLNGKDFTAVHNTVTRLHTRKGQFSCTTYLMAPQNGVLSQPVLALHLERDFSAMDAIDKVAARYHLTEREEETLKGVALGLTSKELADRMHISPNTVKAFLRLIMIKMGATTRSGIVGKILQSQHDTGNNGEYL